jgi:hypothetical protein
MSLDVVKEQIERFLNSDSPEVMAIKGAWGVGKTYTWNKLLNDANKDQKVKYKKYSYISLFGVNSLESFKYSVFEQTISTDLIGKSPSLETFKSNADSLLMSLGKKSFHYFQSAPLVKNFAPAIQSASFLSVNKAIICIDDFERKSKNIALRDILGLVLLLKEQRDCKVVLIFNDEKMGEENADEYRHFREKVIDFEIEFKPTSKECIGIALPDNDEITSKLGDLIGRLRVSNIRVIKKIERVAQIISPMLRQYEKEVLDQALHTLCLYSFCFYSSDKSVPDYKYVLNLEYAFFGLYGEKKQSDEEREWSSILHEYGYKHADEFDLRIAEAVEKGYVDEESLHLEARKKNDQIIASKSESLFTEAWMLYHDTFSDNEPELIDSLINSFKKNAKYISKLDLNGTVRLFRELGEENLASKVIELYIKAHKDNPAVFNLNDYRFSDHVTDDEIRERFGKLADGLKEERTVKDVLSKIADGNDWGGEDEKILGNASSDEFFDVFKSEEGKRLHSYVKACLSFDKFSNATGQQKKIANNAINALKKIAKESTLNAHRVQKFGVTLDSGDENA